jgi:hypothetical protein
MCCRHIWALACVVIHSRQETSGYAGSTISDSESAYNRFISVHVMHVDLDNTTKPTYWIPPWCPNLFGPPR